MTKGKGKAKKATAKKLVKPAWDKLKPGMMFRYKGGSTETLIKRDDDDDELWETLYMKISPTGKIRSSTMANFTELYYAATKYIGMAPKRTTVKKPAWPAEKKRAAKRQRPNASAIAELTARVAKLEQAANVAQSPAIPEPPPPPEGYEVCAREDAEVYRAGSASRFGRMGRGGSCNDFEAYYAGGDPDARYVWYRKIKPQYPELPAHLAEIWKCCEWDEALPMGTFSDGQEVRALWTGAADRVVVGSECDVGNAQVTFVRAQVAFVRPKGWKP